MTPEQLASAREAATALPNPKERAGTIGAIGRAVPVVMQRAENERRRAKEARQRAEDDAMLAVGRDQSPDQFAAKQADRCYRRSDEWVSSHPSDFEPPGKPNAITALLQLTFGSKGCAQLGYCIGGEVDAETEVSFHREIRAHMRLLALRMMKMQAAAHSEGRRRLSSLEAASRMAGQMIDAWCDMAEQAPRGPLSDRRELKPDGHRRRTFQRRLAKAIYAATREWRPAKRSKKVRERIANRLSLLRNPESDEARKLSRAERTAALRSRPWRHMSRRLVLPVQTEGHDES